MVTNIVFLGNRFTFSSLLSRSVVCLRYEVTICANGSMWCSTYFEILVVWQSMDDMTGRPVLSLFCILGMR